jgi:ribonuclease VapC
MIAVDTSAIVAIILKEPERGEFRRAIRIAGKTLISAVSVVEARMVIQGRLGQRGIALADGLLRLPSFQVVPPGTAEIEAAHAAFIAYGKGSGHPANLNFGDLFAYALAKVRGLPLLYKGNDFAQTDIRAAVAAGA